MTAATRTTKHTCGGPSFGRKTAGCPRCDELIAGAAPVVQAWRKQPTRAQDDAQRAAEVRAHLASVRHNDPSHTLWCGRVCTFGEW